MISLQDDYEYNGRVIEGFVIEDSAGYMTKLKLAYYNFWKFMRTISYEAIRNGYIKKTSALTTPLANEYYISGAVLDDNPLYDSAVILVIILKDIIIPVIELPSCK